MDTTTRTPRALMALVGPQFSGMGARSYEFTRDLHDGVVLLTEIQDRLEWSGEAGDLDDVRKCQKDLKNLAAALLVESERILLLSETPAAARRWSLTLRDALQGYRHRGIAFDVTFA